MFSNKKKSPSVKIPAKVLKKEAEKIAKQIIKKEEQKEKKRLVREKAKAKAKAKVEKQKVSQSAWNEHMNSGISREIYGMGWIFFGLVLLAIFLTPEGYSAVITAAAQWAFGQGVWFAPFLAVVLGLVLLLRREVHFLPGRVAALLGWWAFFLGFLHLWVPFNEADALSGLYGGKLGFTVTFLVRTLFGDLVSVLFVLAGFVITGMIGFGLTIEALIERIKELSHKDQKTFSVKNKAKTVETTVKAETETKATKPVAETKRFENKLEIIDATKHMAQAKPKTQEDEMGESLEKTFGHWEAPSLDLLQDAPSTVTVNEAQLREKADAIREKLEQFGLEVEMRSVHVGPTVTQFTLEPAAGVKLTKITGLKSDLALALAAQSLRIEAPIPGKRLVGIEIPNEDRAIVGMREILESESWAESDAALKLAIGRDVAGKPKVVDLAKMPHLLIAGKTGSGKSVAMNAFLISLLWNNSPDQLRLILVDPKRVELKPYDNLPHLLTPVIVEPEKSVSALAWAVAEMNRRLRKLSQHGVRHIQEYNDKVDENPELELEKEPYIVIVIDELADLMMVAGKDVEAAVVRIAQLARAVGMHLIVATQRPSVDVVTGLIKANLPARVAFRVNTGIDSRTIIDGVGAEELLGWGDMLYMDANSGVLTRNQGLYISTEEVDRITNHIKRQFPEMIANDEITKQSIEGMAKGGVLTAGNEEEPSDDDLDDKYTEAVAVVLETGKASASFLQRRLEVGYARAARILDQMEAKGLIGPARGAKPREIYGVPDTP